MSKYIPTIGLEVHAELKTHTKMFCNSKNDPDERSPNINVCPVCMAHPGTLPTINKEAVKHVLRVGYALESDIADYTEFDRKNYFYPDIPKGYQISQYKFPLVSGGSLNGVAITRVHLEEDTARSTHDAHDDESLVDFNRAGIPLMELVTEPVIKTAEEASAFARELQLLLRTLSVSDANMEKGEMRVEANISVSTDAKKFGTKVEIKNLNSFKVVEKAIIYEIKRQQKALEDGGEIIQETRGWDEKKEATFSQRKKEDSHDYRYFPDPDLPKMKLSEVAEFKDLKLPELPKARRKRYKKEYGIKDEDIEMYVRSDLYGIFFESVAGFLDDKNAIKLASNYITTNIAGFVKVSEIDFPAWLTRKDSAPAFAKLVKMAQDKDISSNSVVKILEIMFKGGGGDPKDIAEKEGLLQKNDEGELKSIVEKIITDNPKIITDFKSGNERVLQFLVGQGMKETRGAGNPQVLGKLFKELIK